MGADNGTATDQQRHTIPADPPNFDRGAVTETVAGNLAAVFKDDSGPDAPETVDNPAQQDDAVGAEVHAGGGDAAVLGAKPNESGESGAKPEDEAAPETKTENAAGAAAEEAPSLPAAYVRSLKAYEWTDEEIASAAKRPEMLPMIAKIHATRNKETAEWAKLGREARAKNPEQIQQPGAADLPKALAPVDVAKLKEHYGDDTLINSIVDPVNQVIAKINAILPAVLQTQQKSQQAETEILVRQIDGFFGGKELKPFAKVYGDAAETSKLEPTHLESRNKVLELAGVLMDGAKLQGRSLTLIEALQLAHDSVSSGFKIEAARSQIKSQMQTRQRGITQRPRGRGRDDSTGAPKNRDDLVSRTAARLTAAFQAS